MKEAHDHHRVTPEGKALGAQLARLTEIEVAKLAADGEPDERCVSCAFRAGTVPNGCPQTGLDALKATIEGVPFLCHVKKGRVCYGWFALRQAGRRAEVALGPRTVPWDFSPPDVSP